MLQDASRCFKMLQDASRCFKMGQDGSRWIKLLQAVPRRSKMIQAALRCPKFLYLVPFGILLGSLRDSLGVSSNFDSVLFHPEFNSIRLGLFQDLYGILLVPFWSPLGFLLGSLRDSLGSSSEFDVHPFEILPGSLRDPCGIFFFWCNNFQAMKD